MPEPPPPPPDDDRPSTGVRFNEGESQGGPTGLFTVYDGETLKKGDFTFSVAYSNYDREVESVIGLRSRVAAALSYPIAVIALVLLVREKENRFLRFHALQSILMHISFIVVALGWWIIVIAVAAIIAVTNNGEHGGWFGLFSGIIWAVMLIAYAASAIFAGVRAYLGNALRLPLIGNLAEKWSN
jgi:uncharacterized membrane protein